MNHPTQVTVHAPASIANLAVGFDLLGQAFSSSFDTVSATRTSEFGVHTGTVSGLVDKLPLLIQKNTALRGAQAVLNAAGNPFGVRIDVDKGIPLSAGLGGSAASSVGAVVAVNALLPKSFSRPELFEFALEGERASSDPPPKDNTAACLFGGLILVVPEQENKVIRLPTPKDVCSLVFHPDLEIETGESRKNLSATNSQAVTIDVAGRIAAFTHACHQNDIGLLRTVMQDVWIEPQRASSIAPFKKVQQAALQLGAISCSISGSGPSIFAWVEDRDLTKVKQAMQSAFDNAGIAAKAYDAPLTSGAARVVPT